MIIEQAGKAIDENIKRKKLIVQNLSRLPLKVLFGREPENADDFDLIVPGGERNDDGTGGLHIFNDYTGSIHIHGVGIRCNVTEL